MHIVVLDPKGENLLELAAVERHWSIESIMCEVEVATGNPDLFPSAELSHEDTVLVAICTLPDYESIANGSVLQLSYDKDSFAEEVELPVAVRKKKIDGCASCRDWDGCGQRADYGVHVRARPGVWLAV